MRTLTSSFTRLEENTLFSAEFQQALTEVQNMVLGLSPMKAEQGKLYAAEAAGELSEYEVDNLVEATIIEHKKYAAKFYKLELNDDDQVQYSATEGTFFASGVATLTIY